MNAKRNKDGSVTLTVGKANQTIKAAEWVKLVALVSDFGLSYPSANLAHKLHLNQPAPADFLSD